MTSSQVAGGAGVIIAVVALLLLWKRGPLLWIQLAPPLMYVCYALLAICQVSFFRDGIAPWYVIVATNFWLGVAGICYLLWRSSGKKNEGEQSGLARFSRLTALAWAAGSAAIILGLLAYSNRTHYDKSFYLLSRSPLTASFLRNYLTAPTYAENAMVLWTPGNAGFVPAVGSVLEEHHLSVFAPDQEWTLQGDSGLDTVKYDELDLKPGIWWSTDLTDERLLFTDYRHLNLFLPSPQSVSWTVSIPPGVKKAIFSSADAVSTSAPQVTVPEAPTFQVYLKESQRPEKLVYSDHPLGYPHRWHPFSISLAQYAGKTITLRLTSEPGAYPSSDWAMYRYPVIDFDLGDVQTNPPPQVPIPMNTDLSPKFPKPDGGDLNFDVTRTAWSEEGMTWIAPAGGGRFWRIDGDDPALVYREPLAVRLSKYSDFYFRVRMPESPGDLPRAVQVFYMLDSAPYFSPKHSLTVPLLKDEQAHAYTFPLRLLGDAREHKLVGLKIALTYPPHLRGRVTFSLFDFRLLKRRTGQ